MIWAGDLLRVYVPAANTYFPFNLVKTLLREKEKNQLSGTCYFSLGCTLAIAIFPSAVATLSIMWLILGDMSAALIGVDLARRAAADEAVALARVPALPLPAVIPYASVGAGAARRAFQALVLLRRVGLAT